MEQDRYTSEQLSKDMKILKMQSAIQTVAVILFFAFGISTINDLVKKK